MINAKRNAVLPIVAVLAAVGVATACTTASAPIRPADYQISSSAPQPYGGPGIACSRVPPPRMC